MLKALRKLLVFIGLGTTLLFVSSINTFAYYTNMSASVVIGQADFVSNSANRGGTATAATLNVPNTILKVNNKLIVSDGTNHRVLIYNSVPSSNNASADVVIGQSSMTASSANQGGTANANTLNAPRGMATDGTKLFVVDALNNRVLVFNTIPTSNNVSADVVIGQPDFTTATPGTATNKTNVPLNINYDPATGKLAFTDLNNNRVLIYNQVPTTNSASADVVVGQTGSAAANTLNGVVSVNFINGKLFVGDSGNSRILIWNSIPTASGTSADTVIGQQNFTDSSVNQGGGTTAGANTLSGVGGVTSGSGRLFVTDGNNRMLIFNAIPTINNASADVVIGQQNFTGSTANQGGSAAANTLNNPKTPSVFDNQLFVADATNSRVLIFNNILSTPGLNISSPVAASGGKVRIDGNVVLGELGRYSLQTLQADVNGQGFSDVTAKFGGRDLGTSQTIYDFFHEFEPWAGIAPKDQYDPSSGYTVKFKASNYNAEDSFEFYFSPFTLTSVTGTITPTLKLTLPKNSNAWARIKDNVNTFDIKYQAVSTNTSSSQDWITLDSTKPTDSMYNTITGTFTLTTTKQIPSGNYIIKAVVRDNWQHSQDSNTLPATSTGIKSYAPSFPITSLWFPLQINSITGAYTGIISSYSSILTNTFNLSTSYPRISGIAFAGSSVTVLVTNPTTLKQNTYTTQTKSDSTWTITPTVSSTSVIDTWVSLNGIYNTLPAFELVR